MKVLGVDIGAYEVKTVLLEAGLFRRAVKAVAVHPVGDRPLADVVAEATRGKFDVVSVSLDRKLVVTRNLTLPFKDRAQLRKVVPFEAESLLPFTAEKGYIDHHVIDDSGAEGTDVLVVAVSHRDFELFRPLLEATGRADAFHQIDSYGAVNALFDTGAPMGGTVAVIDLAHTKTAIEIVRNGKLRFSRCLDSGGIHMTQLLARRLELSDAEAGRRKEAALGNEAPVPEDRALLDPILDKLVKEIRFTFLSYQQTAGGGAVERGMAIGGGARGAAVLGRLSERLGIPVIAAEPRAAAPLPDEVRGDFPRFAIAYGTAVRGVQGVLPQPVPKGQVVVDFLRDGRSFWQYHRQRVSAAVTAALVLALVYVLVQVGQIRRLEARSAALDVRLEAELEGINKASDARGRKRIALANLETAGREAARRLELLRKGATPPLGILNEISQLVPKGTNFTLRLFIVETGLVTIVAETNTNEESDQITEAIKRSRVFAGVRKTEAGPSPDNPGRVQFKVQFKTAA